MYTSVPPTLRACLATIVLGILSSAFAYDGFTIGAFGSIPSDETYTVNVRAVQPLGESHVNGSDLQFAVRADIASSVTFQAVPALGVAGVVGADEDGVERYLGVGAGAGWVLGSPLWTAYGVTGLRTPIAAGLHGAVEFQLATHRMGTVPSLGFALEYTFGGGQ